MLSYATYLVSGAVLTVLGPLVPEITLFYGISYTMLGTAMVLNSLAYLPAVLLGGFICGRYSAQRVATAGLLLMTLGYAVMAMADQWWLFVAGYCAGGGLGFGLLEAGLNALVMEQAGGRQGAALNLLHVYAAGGAIAGPILARTIVALTGNWQLAYAALAMLFCVAAGVFGLYRLPRKQLQQAESPPNWSVAAKSLFNPVLAILAVAMTFYVGVEIGLSSWMYSYIVNEVGGGALLGASLNSLFWGGLGLGRLASAYCSEKFGYERFLFLGALAATVAFTPALFWQQPIVITIALFCTGFLFAGSFPTILAIGAKMVPEQSGPVAGMLIFFAGVGTMVFPPVMGYLADVKGIWHAMALAFYCMIALSCSTAALLWQVSAKRMPYCAQSNS